MVQSIKGALGHCISLLIRFVSHAQSGAEGFQRCLEHPDDTKVDCCAGWGGRLSCYRYKSLIKAQPRSHSLYLHKVMALHVRQNNHLQPLLLPTSDQVSYILLIHTMQCLGFRLKTITNTKIKPFSIYALWKCYYHDCKGEWTRSTETEKGFQPNEHKPDKTKTG